MTKDRKAYMKAYHQAHKDQAKAWYEAHKDQVNVANKAWKEANKEQVKAANKAWKEAHKEYAKAWREAHKDQAIAANKAYRQAHKEHYNAYMKDYIKADVNSLGQTKHSIRRKSSRILKQMNLHIDGYEIHHCFGYEDASKFIYISKSLHLKIHKYLRDNNIDASNDHWMLIRDIVNDTNEFTYIKS